MCVEVDERIRLDVAKMREALVPEDRLDGSVLFRPTRGDSFVELDARLVQDAFEELVRNAILAPIVHGSVSARDRLLYQLFCEHAAYCGAVEETETESGD